MEHLKDIILEITSYRSQKFNPSDDMILDCATRIFNSPKHQPKPYQTDEEVDRGERASLAQINLLYKLKADFNADTITKHEAYNLIRKLKGVK